MNKKKEPIKFTLYLPDEINEQLDWIKFKTKNPKNSIVLKALEKYLPKLLKKYPGYKGAKSE